MGVFSEACGITIFCDRNHNLIDPIHFSSHKEAARYLNRSYTFVYQMVRNGEAIEDKHSSQTITVKAQTAGRNSSNWVESHVDNCIKDPMNLQQSSLIAVKNQAHATQAMKNVCSRRVRGIDPNGVVYYYTSRRECMEVTGNYGVSRWLKDPNYTCSRGPWKGWRFEYT